MKIVHISDTHGFHEKMEIPECDILIHSGDAGERAMTLSEFNLFLIWLDTQPARKKIYVAGNHDHVMSRKWMIYLKQNDPINGLIGWQMYEDARKLLENYPNVKYLEDKDYVFEGVKFYGSPYSPTFHPDRWCFNANRGSVIASIWGKIPSDVDVLITHTPPYGILDYVQEITKEEPDNHRGCEDLMKVVKKRLFKLKLHAFGHIHENYGYLNIPISNKRRGFFSNGAVLIHTTKDSLITKPLIINI